MYDSELILNGNEAISKILYNPTGFKGPRIIGEEGGMLQAGATDCFYWEADGDTSTGRDLTVGRNLIVTGSSSTIPGYATTAEATYAAGPGISIIGNVITNTGGGGGGGSAFTTPITTTNTT